MLNKELFAKIHDFVVSSSRLLNSFLEKGEEIPYKIVEKYEVKERGSWSMNYVTQPFILPFILRHEKDIENLPEFKICVRLLRTEPQVSDHLDKLVGIEGGGSFRRTVWDFMWYFLTPMFEKYLKESKFDQQLLKQLYSHFEKFIRSSRIRVRTYVYLDNFDSDIDRIDIEKNLSIRKVTNEEIERLLERSKGYTPFSLEIPPKYIIEMRYTRKKIIGGAKKPPRSDPSNRIYQFVTALRLFKSGVVGFNEISTTPETPFFWGYSRRSGGAKTFRGPKYVLRKEEIIQFKDFWKQISTFFPSEPRRLAIARRRFEIAYERSLPQDKLIDFMIAYEALFFKQGELGEFGHKLSTRVSKLLRKTYQERATVAKEVKEFYDKRSKIVHGEEVKLHRGFIDKVESYLRDSIKTLMEKLVEKDLDEIILHLDLD